MQHKRAIRNNKYQRRGATSSVLPSVCHSTFLVRHFASMSWSCFCYMDTRSHAQPLCAVYCRLSARLWRMLTACSAASAMRSSAGWRSFMCVQCLITVPLRVLAYAMPSAVLTVQTNCACVALRCGRLQHPATPLQRPCNGLATALQRPCNGAHCDGRWALPPSQAERQDLLHDVDAVQDFVRHVATAGPKVRFDLVTNAIRLCFQWESVHSA